MLTKILEKPFRYDSKYTKFIHVHLATVEKSWEQTSLQKDKIQSKIKTLN